MSTLLLLLSCYSIITSATTDSAVFAGGCFWCMEPPFEKLSGVHKVISGYMGGTKTAPTYEDVSRGNSGYREVVLVQFNPDQITYDSLVSVFWRNIDPTDDGGQFIDRGSQYKSAIFYFDSIQKQLATKSRLKLERSKKFKKPIITEILPSKPFFAAEPEHQDFYKTNAEYYSEYKRGSGREDFIHLTWEIEMPQKQNLRDKLTTLQYHVTQECGTEPPFNNEYYNNKREGIYVDIVSGEPLFWSGDKFESGTGWPSFTKPLATDNVVEKTDTSLGMSRTEVRSKKGDSHLGHVFPDGPAPGGLRYCINSSSLKFIPKESMEKEGYGDYLKLFKSKN